MAAQARAFEAAEVLRKQKEEEQAIEAEKQRIRDEKTKEKSPFSFMLGLTDNSVEMGETGGQKEKEDDEHTKVNAGTGDHTTSPRKMVADAPTNNTMRNLMYGGILMAGATLGYMYYKRNTK